jgi:HAD superfamily hydrolase (TIGR01509 family)
VIDTGAGAIVFDFDGVLADTERLHLAAFQDAFIRLGWQLDEATYFSRYLGFDDRGLVAELARDRGVALGARDLEAVVRAKGERFAERLGAGEALYPKAAACVRRLGARYPLAIASGALRREIVFVLEAAGLTSAFRTIVAADDVAKGKPAPDSYAEAVRRLGVAPARTVAVEDSRWGLESARAAGLRAIGITTSYPPSELAAADAIVDSLDELTESLIDAVLTPR